MSTPDHVARSNHAILRKVLITLAIGVLVVCVLMWWWVTAPAAFEPAAVGSAPPVSSSAQASTSARSPHERPCQLPRGYQA